MSLMSGLPDWSAGAAMGAALKRLGWLPRSIREKVYLAVAERDGVTLKRLGNQCDDVLWKDIESDNWRTVEYAFNALIALGRPGSATALIDALNRRGGKTVAEIFLNSGNGELADAAKRWADDHGYYIQPRPPGASGNNFWASW